MSKKRFTKIIQEKSKYNLLVEVGCGELENITIASSNNMKYIGLDFSATRIKVDR